MTASISGVGISAFGRHPQQTLESLGADVARRAMLDADCPAASIGYVFCANALGSRLFGDTTIGQSICARIGIRGVPVVNVENACTSGSTAFHLAWQTVASGGCDHALVVGVEKMHGATLGLIDSGRTDADTRLGLVAPASFALRAVRHMYEYGTTPAQLAAVTVKSRRQAALNPLACIQRVETLRDVLDSPMISDPLTRSQCCPIADGAAAVIVSRATRSSRRSIAVRHSVLVSGNYVNPFDLARWDTDDRAAHLAYEGAGIGPEDLDLVECHDAFTIAEILHCEALGLCPRGEGGGCAERGETSLGGRIPINVSGGLLSRGHPVAATGVAQLVELVLQLRGERGALQVPGSRVGLAQCMGGDKLGDAKSCTVAILST